jgi:hypothetical protein
MQAHKGIFDKEDQLLRLLPLIQLICELHSSPTEEQTPIEKSNFSQSHISRQLCQLSQADLMRSECQGE